jgi:streptomycin 6-kinase
MAISEEKIGRGLLKLAPTLQAWQLSADGDFFIAGNSLLQPVLFERQPAMLKIPLSDKGQAGFRLLACWNGNAAVTVYKYDAVALLMERAVGKRSLRRMVLDGREDEANTIVCGVVRQLHAHPCGEALELAPLASWSRSLAEAATTHGGVFATCHEIADALLRDPHDTVALHGDIHYDNILDSGHEGNLHADTIPGSSHRGWVAIDPKGVMGELAVLTRDQYLKSLYS